MWIQLVNTNKALRKRPGILEYLLLNAIKIVSG